MKKIEICDRCKREFYRNFNTSKQSLSLMNDVNYWTDGKGWNDYKILCRACLKDWKTNHKNEFVKLVNKEKKKYFYTYSYNGFLDRNDLVTK